MGTTNGKVLNGVCKERGVKGREVIWISNILEKKPFSPKYKIIFFHHPAESISYKVQPVDIYIYPVLKGCGCLKQNETLCSQTGNGLIEGVLVVE